MAAPRWLAQVVLPFLMFAFTRTCRIGKDHGWDRAQKLSASHGSGGADMLDGLPEAFDAFVHAHRRRLQRPRAKGWLVLYFFCKWNSRTALLLVAEVMLFIVLRCVFACVRACVCARA